MKNTFFGKSYITVENLTKEDVSRVFQKANAMKEIVLSRGGIVNLHGKIMACIFYEPSSRTYSSFISAMQRLGGGIIPLSGMTNTSVSKGESLSDSAKVFSSYADIIVMRHPQSGAVEEFATSSEVPVINAGDGINEHPTQALLDAYTIREEIGKLDGIHIAFFGELGHYRPINSLAKLFSLYPSTKLSFVSPPEVKLQDNVKNYLNRKKINFREYTSLDNIIKEIDVLYVSRVKKEYMPEKLYKSIQGKYVIDLKTVQKMKEKSIIMHPLPRVGEIQTEVDSDHRAMYLRKQMRNGMYVRMALLDLILRRQ